MKKEIIKNIIVFAAGSIIGSFITAKIVKSKYNYTEVEVLDSQDDSNSDIEKTQEEMASVAEVEEKKLVLAKDHYKKIARNYNEININGSDELKNQIYEGDRPTLFREPYIISNDQFSEEKDHYDKLSLFYYEDDDTVTDESEEIVTDAESLIGDNALGSFGIKSDDKDIVYVRNDKLEIDYEVTCLHQSYSETVLGFQNDDGRRSIRRSDSDE